MQWLFAGLWTTIMSRVLHWEGVLQARPCGLPGLSQDFVHMWTAGDRGGRQDPPETFSSHLSEPQSCLRDKVFLPGSEQKGEHCGPATALQQKPACEAGLGRSWELGYQEDAHSPSSVSRAPCVPTGQAVQDADRLWAGAECQELPSSC